VSGADDELGCPSSGTALGSIAEARGLRQGSPLGRSLVEKKSGQRGGLQRDQPAGRRFSVATSNGGVAGAEIRCRPPFPRLAVSSREGVTRGRQGDRSNVRRRYGRCRRRRPRGSGNRTWRAAGFQIASERGLSFFPAHNRGGWAGADPQSTDDRLLRRRILMHCLRVTAGPHTAALECLGARKCRFPPGRGQGCC